VNETNEPKYLDDYDIIIDEYASLIANSNNEDPLLFWKNNEYSFPLLAPLAKRFLGVPALNVCSIFQDIFLLVKEDEQMYISMKI